MAKFDPPSRMAPSDPTTIAPPPHVGHSRHHHHHSPETATTATHTTVTQPLHSTATDQTPVATGDTTIHSSTTATTVAATTTHGTMPPSARHSTASSRFSGNRSSSISVSTTSSSPDTFIKCTPMTVQMTPDYDIVGDPIGTTVPKQLCALLSSSELEGTPDASSTEAADSSKSSEYEVSDDVLLRFGRMDPSPLQTPPKATTTASRMLFSLDHINTNTKNSNKYHDECTHLDQNHLEINADDDDDDDDDVQISHNYSDILMDSTSTPYDTPNHSIATGSPNSFDRTYSDGNVSPIHPPNHHPQRRSLHFNFSAPPIATHAEVSPRYHSTCHHDNTNANDNNSTTSYPARKQLRSRRSVRNGQRPKSCNQAGTHRGQKKAGGSKGRKNPTNYTDYSLPVNERENHRNGMDYGDNDSFDVECYSTESDDDDFVIEDRSERSRDSSSTRMKQHSHHHPRLSSSTTRRKSSMTATTKQYSWWKNIPHRLSTTQNLIWLLCFVGLTSVTMIVTMNQHMAQVAHMEQQNHFSILFNHPMAKTRGLLLPPPKMTPPLIPTEPNNMTLAIKKQQIRGSKPTTENVAKASTFEKIAATPPKSSESTATRRTVNLNTLAQLPHEHALQKLMLSDHRSGPNGSSSSNDHHSKSHHHHGHGDEHPVDDSHHHHHHHHHTTTSDQQYHSHHHSSSSGGAISEQHGKHEESNHESEEHHHHHSHDHSIRLYVKASPVLIGTNAIRKVAVPDIWDDDGVQLSFDRIDPFLYEDNFETTDTTIVPRIVFLDGEFFLPSRGERTVRRHRSEITDSTQLYSILDSGDERIASMELRAPYVQGECVPMQEWQTTFNPSCNGMHELDLASMGDNRMEDDFKLFGMNGFWRNAWRYDSTGGHSSLKERDKVVLKTLRINHRFEDAYFENNRIDAVVLERLTASPHVINVFGFCGHSVLTEFADGKRLGELADKMAKVPLARLQIARDIANGLADVHGIDGDGNATFVHLDINPANVVSIGGTLKLNDFNIGVLRRWNTTSNSPCGIPAKYPNPQWRSPEEARLEQNLTEKVDVFSLGHIFFRLICSHEPWHKLEPGGMPSKEELSEKVRQGILPTIPEEIMTSNDPEVVAIREAMLRCYTYDPIGRPSAREIAIYLQQSLNALETDANSAKVLIE